MAYGFYKFNKIIRVLQEMFRGFGFFKILWLSSWGYNLANSLQPPVQVLVTFC